MGLTSIDQIEYEVERVDADDYGDEYYKYHILYYNQDGLLVYDDYTHNKPNDTECYNILYSIVSDGGIQGVTLYDE